MDAIDKLGCCPNCKISWDGGDVFQELSKMDIFSLNSHTSMENIASNFGWKSDNKSSFSKVKVIEKDGRTLYECPNLRCGYVYDKTIGEFWKSLMDFNMDKESKKALIVGTAGELNTSNLSEVFYKPEVAVIENKPVNTQYIDSCPFDAEEYNKLKKNEEPVQPKPSNKLGHFLNYVKKQSNK